MPTVLTLDQLIKHWPHADRSLLAGIAASAEIVLPKYSITTALAVAMMMGQFSEETGGGVEMVENIHYSPARACAVWPSRFRSVGDVYAKIGSTPGDPQFSVKLMDNVYGNRMGNRPGTHDGSMYIGRGLSQCTGRGEANPPSGYMGVWVQTHIDVMNHPELMCAPSTALECAVADFVMCGCLLPARQGDIITTTKRLNGGLIGLRDREMWTEVWKHEFGI